MKHTISGFITYEKCPFTSKEKISFQTWKPGKEFEAEKVVVREHSIEVDVPDGFDPRPGFIAALKEKERKARADFEALCTDIRRQISQYEAIGMDDKS